MVTRHYSFKSWCFAAVSIVLVAAPDIAFACSCAYRRYGPFYSGGLLPANAKGVVYRNTSVRGDSDESNNNIVVKNLPPKPKAEFFEIVNTTINDTIDASIVKLDTTALDSTAEKQRRYFLYQRKEYENCGFSRDESRICRELRQIKRNNPQDWVTKLRERGEVIEVTAEFRARSGFFRIEPDGGFRAGHRYTIQTTQEVSEDTNEAEILPSGSITVNIDSRTVPLSTLRDVRLELREPPDLEMISIPEGGLCSKRILADVQHVNYEVPEAIAPFQDSLVIFTTIAEQHDTDSPYSQPIFEPWYYRSGACSSVKFGQSDVGFAKDLIFATCKPFQRRNPYQVKARYGMLEIHDSLLASNVEMLTVKTRTASECSPAKLLAEMVARGNADELKQKLCWVGSSWENFIGDPIDLLESVLELTEHEDVQIRQCAVSSVMGLYLGKLNFNRASITDRLIPALVKIVTDNQNSTGIRTYISERLEFFVRRDANNAISRRRQRLIEQVPLLAKALEDDEADVRNGVAEILTYLGSDAKAAIPALIAAIRNEEKPTDEAIEALIAIDPSHPQIIPALIAVLRDRPHFAGTTIGALVQVGASDPRVPPVLIQLVKRGSSSAIGALGALGSSGAEAVPLLLEIARKSEYQFQRRDAIDSLIKIGTPEQELFAVIVENIKDPIDTRSRQITIESLGALGPNARELYPEVLAVLNDNPTDRELSAAMRTLRAIDAPTEAIKSSFISVLERQTTLDRGSILAYLVRLDPMDGRIIEALLREDSDRLLGMGCDAITPDNVPQLSNKPAIVAALAAILEDDTRNFHTAECVMEAASNLMPVESQSLCLAIRDRKTKEENSYRIEKYERFEAQICSL